tara:strand:- start:187 stop:399 length:213 start_codon:yes stop_codon:yes gene_type:complete
LLSASAFPCFCVAITAYGDEAEAYERTGLEWSDLSELMVLRTGNIFMVWFVLDLMDQALLAVCPVEWHPS